MFRFQTNAVLIVLCLLISLHKTTEAQSWNRIKPFIEGGDSLADMSSGIFINRNVGWFYPSGSQNIYQTLDGGYKWNVLTHISTGWPLHLYALDSLHVWTLILKPSQRFLEPHTYYVFHTSDGGVNWDSSFIAQTSQEFAKLLFFDSHEGLAFNNHPWLTKDSCRTWTILDSTTNLPAITDVEFINRKTGWVVGDGNPFVTDRGFIAHTTDGGYNWTYQANSISGPYPPLLYSVTFIDDSTGFAIGNNMNFIDGFVLSTTDGGNNWKKIRLTATGKLNDIKFIDRKNGWISGEIGRIWNTTDGGENWNFEEIGVITKLGNIVPLKNDNCIYVMGDKGTLLYKNLRQVHVNLNAELPITNLLLISPNPFKQATTVKFSLDQESYVHIKIFDILGQGIRTLANDKYEQGTHSLTLDTHGWKPGIYFCIINAKSFYKISKIVKVDR